ncbi:MAG: hypothetical protein V4721_03765 [Bacteroidota bacterium]
MFDIYLSETGHSGLFSAKTLLGTVGSLAFRYSGPHSLLVTSLEVEHSINLRPIAYELLDSLHRYAYDTDCTITFRCPKAKAINDQQIAHELMQLSLLQSAAA